MDRKKIIFLVLTIIILVGLAVATKVFFLDRQSNSVSGLQVDSSPQASVYVNGQIVGKTPYSNEKMTPGEYTIKLVATGATGTFYPWESKIKLTDGGLTYVSRDIGDSDENSGDQILWLEKIPSTQNGELAVVSDPDSARISVDAVDKGNASNIFKDIPTGDHEIIISDDGYSDQIIKAKIVAGFRLNAAIKLARNTTNISQTPIASPSATASSSASVTATSSASSDFTKPYVLIKDTGTGFLRVRTEPSISATEAGKVKPGDKYSLLLEQSGWTKIQISTSSGWVNDQYIQKFK